MSEKIGQVVLDDTYYPGKDLYTDGAIEDEMLEIARTYPEEKWNQVIAERKSWPILYHFSHIRENILSWLPFTGEENVLEIGSGCGAVTGALCKKAKSVTCIELSRKRSLINANRHKDFDNLKILMGNFQDIEKNLTEKYDYITLIGVFEYGEAYIQSSTPYVDFLKIISRHLKPDGKIVLAIENRFGLKYWAGRNIGKKDMVFNDKTPEITVDPETYEVKADGVSITSKPAKKLPLTQLYNLF